MCVCQVEEGGSISPPIRPLYLCVPVVGSSQNFRVFGMTSRLSFLYSNLEIMRNNLYDFIAANTVM